MKINAVNDRRTEVELPEEELRGLGVQWETLDWGDIETRRALWSIYGAVRAEGLAPLPGGKLLIEAVRTPGGVRLCFTSLPRRAWSEPRLVRGGKVPVLRCDTRRALENAAKALGEKGLRAFAGRDAWFLLAEGTYGEGALARAAEFGTLCRMDPQIALPTLEEYCKPL